MAFSEDSDAELMETRELQVQDATEGAIAEGVVGDSRFSRVVGTSTPVKLLDGVRHESLLLWVMPVGTPVKSASNDVLAVEESGIDTVAVV